MQIVLEEWGPDDLEILRRANTPELTRYLGGVETDDALVERHAEYLDHGEGTRMFRVEVDGAVAGYAGWWEEEHDGIPAYEIGCVVEPDWQGRGVATIALGEVVQRASAAEDPRPIVSYADVGNAASNALCARVGLSLVGTGEFAGEDGEAPMAVNVWMLTTSVRDGPGPPS